MEEIEGRKHIDNDNIEGKESMEDIEDKVYKDGIEAKDTIDHKDNNDSIDDTEDEGPIADKEGNDSNDVKEEGTNTVNTKDRDSLEEPKGIDNNYNTDDLVPTKDTVYRDDYEDYDDYHYSPFHSTSTAHKYKPNPKKEEEDDIEEFKPGPMLYIWLFVFYTIWVLQAFGSISFCWRFGFDEFVQIEEFGLLEWILIPIFLFGSVYCFYAVIKVLRGDRDCITALKWAVMYSLIYVCFNPLRAQTPVTSIPYALIILLARPLFYLGFYLYLCFSKAIKRRYPKKERTFSPSGWVWSGITVCLVALAGWSGYEGYKQHQFCQRLDEEYISTLDLEEGQVCDGYVAFRSSLPWELSKENIDTIIIGDYKADFERTMEVSQGMDSIFAVYLFSGTSDKKDSRTHNQILTKMLAPLNKLAIEVGHHDTIVGRSHLISTTFKTKPRDQIKTQDIQILSRSSSSDSSDNTDNIVVDTTSPHSSPAYSSDGSNTMKADYSAGCNSNNGEPINNTAIAQNTSIQMEVIESNEIKVKDNTKDKGPDIESNTSLNTNNTNSIPEATETIATPNNLTFPLNPQYLTVTLATIFDLNSPKCIVLLAKIPEEDNQQWLQEILDSLLWDLHGLKDLKEIPNSKKTESNYD